MRTLATPVVAVSLCIALAGVVLGQSAESQPLEPPASLSLEPQPATRQDGEAPVLRSSGGESVPVEGRQQAVWPFTQRGLDFDPILSARQAMEEAGFRWRFRTAMAMQNLSSGGLHTAGATDFADKYNVDLTVDLEKLLKWKGAQIYVEMEGATNVGLSAAGYVGDVLGVDRDAGNVTSAYLKKYIFQQTLDLGSIYNSLKLRFLMGQMDFRDEFDRNYYTYDYRTQFLNKSFTDDPTIAQRDSRLGAVLSLDTDLAYIRSGVYTPKGGVGQSGLALAFDGEPEAMWVGEAGLTPKFDGPNGKLPGNYKLGFWYSGASFKIVDYNTYDNRLPQAFEFGDNGMYVSMDQLIYKENAEATDHQGLGLFMKFGYAEPEVSTVYSNFAFGAAYQGLIPTRNDDVFAVGYDIGTLQAAKPGQAVTDEQVFETYYNVTVFPWFIIGPDLQFILHPDGGRNGATDALVVGVKAYMTF